MAIITTDEVKTFLQITDSSKDDLIDALVPVVDSDITQYCGVSPTAAGAKIPAAMMVGYLMTTMAGGGASIGNKSESQGEYSYTKEETRGYPLSVMMMLDRYKVLVPRYGSKMQQPRDRRGESISALAADKYADGVDGIVIK
jgi:hypothetical protein